MANAILRIPVLSTLITTSTALNCSKSSLRSSLIHDYAHHMCHCLSTATTTTTTASQKPSTRGIRCPDPHFKKRHHKRRIVQKPLEEAIVDSLMLVGQVFIQSGVLEVAVDNRKYFDAESEKLVHVDNIDSGHLCDSEGWLVSNPMRIRTQREIHAEFERCKDLQ